MTYCRMKLSCSVGQLLPMVVAAIYSAVSPAAGASSLLEPQPPIPDTVFHEIDSTYLFGFTEGSDIGEEGEQAIELETTTSSVKRGGSYNAIEQEVEYESVPSQFFAYELSLHGMSHAIDNVEGLDNLNSVAFSGASAELRSLLIGRGPGEPVGLTFVAEPEWARIDGTSGALTRDFSTTFKLVADTELVPRRLYAAANVIYEPEVAKAIGDMAWDRTSLAAVSAALAYRITPKVAIGGEVEYDRAYQGLAFRTFEGHAVYAGPTLNVQFTNQIMLAAAFSTQLVGRAQNERHALDLTDFERYRGNLKLEFEF